MAIWWALSTVPWTRGWHRWRTMAAPRSPRRCWATARRSRRAIRWRRAAAGAPAPRPNNPGGAAPGGLPAVWGGSRRQPQESSNLLQALRRPGAGDQETRAAKKNLDPLALTAAAGRAQLSQYGVFRRVIKIGRVHLLGRVRPLPLDGALQSVVQRYDFLVA